MKLTGLMAAVVLSATSSFAGATSINFNLKDPLSAEGVHNHYADTYNYQVDGVGMSVSGWSSGGDRFRPFGDVSQAQVGLWNGLMGVEGAGSMSHAVDNFAFDFDFLMFEFDREVSLEGVGLGYINNDSDVSIGAYDASDLLAVGNIYDASLGLNSFSAPQIASNIWIVGAFHPAFGAVQDHRWDGFKLNELAVNVNPVPLPAAFWFLATGLVGFGVMRKRASAARVQKLSVQ